MVNQSIMGKGLSKQSFAISPKIREIDEFLKRRPELKDMLQESHPELCFAVLASNSSFILPLYNSKHTPDGHEDRVDTLQEYYSGTYEVIDYVKNNPKLCKLMEDCVDALCLAVTAWLGSKHGYKTVPFNPPKDNRGLPMQMVYPGIRKVDIY
jgi:predicted RNase H-like nuclease